MPEIVLGEWLALFLMAFALSMDAFSVSLGIGMYMNRLKYVIIFIFFIGFFHVLMPVLGIMLGQIVYAHFTPIATTVGGLLLFLLGLQMLFFSQKGPNNPQTTNLTIAKLALLSFSVSLDSFSVGLSLGIFQMKVLLVIFLFGVVSMFVTFLGLLVSKHVTSYFGAYTEAFGGIILIVFGIHLIWPL